jgi:hypothetical protein
VAGAESSTPRGFAKPQPRPPGRALAPKVLQNRRYCYRLPPRRLGEWVQPSTPPGGGPMPPPADRRLGDIPAPGPRRAAHLAAVRASERLWPLTRNVAHSARRAAKVSLPRPSLATLPPLAIGLKRRRGRPLFAERIGALRRCPRSHPRAFLPHPAAIVAARTHDREAQRLRPARVPIMRPIPPAIPAGQQTLRARFPAAACTPPRVSPSPADGRPRSSTHNVARSAPRAATVSLRRSFLARSSPLPIGADGCSTLTENSQRHPGVPTKSPSGGPSNPHPPRAAPPTGGPGPAVEARHE